MIAIVKKVTFAVLTWSVLTVNALSGADCVWTGGDGDGKWSTAGNWQDGKTPSAGDKVVLTGAGTVNGEINNDIGELALSQIVFEGGEPFRLVGAAVSPAAAGSEFLKKTATAAVTNSLALKLPSGDTKVVNSAAGYFVLDGDISGEGARVRVSGGGKVKFAGENSHTGGIRDDGEGSLSFASSAAAGPEGSTVELNGNMEFVPGEYRCSFTSRSTGNLSYFFPINGDYIFHGGFTGSCKNTLFLRSFHDDNRKAVSGTIVFHEGISFPDAELYPLVADNFTVKFLKPVSIRNLKGGYWNDGHTGVWEFHASNNAVPTISPSRHARLYMKTENAFSAATSISYSYSMGTGVNAGIFDLCGFSQTFNRIFHGVNSDRGIIRSTGGAATLLLKGTQNAMTRVLVEDQVSLVWAPEDKSLVQIFSNRVHTTTGDITVTNGIFSVEGAASFANVKNIKVEKDGVFRLDTTKSGALAGAKFVQIASGGTFKVLSGATPFGEGGCMLFLEKDASFEVSAGVVCNVSKLYVDGSAVADGEYAAGSIAGLSGEGTIKVVSVPITCIWSGEGGDGKWSNAANWYLKMKPFAGDSVSLTGVGTVNGEITNDIGELALSQIVFEGSEPFRLVGAAVSPAAAGSEFLKKTATVAVTNSLALKLPSGDTKVVNSAAGYFVLDGDISGEGARVVANGGHSMRVVFAGKNTHTGGIRDGSEGSLAFADAASVGPAGSVVEANRYVYFFAPGEYRCSITNRYSSGDVNYYFLANGNYDFYGDVSGACTKRLMFFSYIGAVKATAGNITFHGELRFPQANEFYAVMATDFTTRFMKPVAVKMFAGGDYANNSVGSYEFYADNAIGTIAPSHTCRLFTKKENAFSEATLISFERYLSSGVGAGILDLCGFNQTMNRISHGSRTTVQGEIRSTGGAATLTLKGTESASTLAMVKDAISLVWAPLDKTFVQSFKNRAHTTTGNITVTNGILSVEGSASFAKVKNITVEKDGVFRLNTSKSGALAGLEKLTIASGGRFEIINAQNPFTAGAVLLNIAEGAVFALPEGNTCDLRGVILNNEAVVGGTYTSDASWIEGGELIVRDLPVERVEALWSGEGSSTSIADVGNWSWNGEGLPPLSGGSLLATFAAGGNTATIDRDVDVMGLSFTGGSDNFTLNGTGLISVRGEGINVGGECTNVVLSAPIEIYADQTWNVSGENSKLTIDSPVKVHYGAETIHKTGPGVLYLNAEALSMGSFTLGSRAENGGVVYVNVATNAFGPASDEYTVCICGVTGNGNQGSVSFQTSTVVERPFKLDSENSYYVFSVRKDVTARFTKKFATTGSTRLSFAENAHVICEGGATLNGWTCFSGARGAKWTFRGEQPITANYFYLRSGQEVSIETVGNTVSGIDIEDGVFTVTRPLGLNTKAMNVYLNNGNSVLSLAGEQTIGAFRLMGGGTITSAVPSTVTFYQDKDTDVKVPITNSAVRITGAVTLFKTGGELYVQDCAANTTGGIGVGEGVLRMTENAKFRDATAFFVKNEGRAELEGERLLGRKVRVDMDSTAKLKLDGTQYVEAFTLDGVEKPWGTYGAPGSGARHELECIEGPGVLTVGTTGAFLIVR